MKQQTGSKSGKEYVKAVYYHPAYLTYIQSTSGLEQAELEHLKVHGSHTVEALL